MADVVATAPADLADDARSVASALDDLFAAYAAAGYDMEALATTAEYAEFVEKYQDPALRAPSERFEAATDERCA